MAKEVQRKRGSQGIFPIWCNYWVRFLVGVRAFRVECLVGRRVFDHIKDPSGVKISPKDNITFKSLPSHIKRVVTERTWSILKDSS